MRWVFVGVLAGLVWAGSAAATVPPGDPEEVGVPIDTVPPDNSTPDTTPSGALPPAAGPLVVLPAECVVPALPVVVFEGTITDAVSTTARYSVSRVLAGSLSGFAVNGQVDVFYGDETRFLAIGGHYIVGAGQSAISGGLASAVREPAPLFGGDAVVGANDSDVDCVTVEDPVRTLLANGQPVDTGVLAPLRGSGRSLLSAILRPLAVAFGVLVALVLVKHLLFAIGRALRELGDGPPPSARRRGHGRTPSEPVETSL